ncbi:MAG: DNA recombination/repair protein RecA, partial [Cetobacterium sp.]
GPQTTTTGGKALKFYSSIRLEVKRIGSVKQGDEMIGNETAVKVTKNKVAPPFKEARFQIMYGKGISRVGEILEIALDNDIVNKSGSWFSFGDIRIGQGKENVKTRLESDKDLLEKIEEEVNKIIGAGKVQAPIDESDSESSLDDDDFTEEEI